LHVFYTPEIKHGDVPNYYYFSDFVAEGVVGAVVEAVVVEAEVEAVGVVGTYELRQLRK
jgi:hypothetical protein